MPDDPSKVTRYEVEPGNVEGAYYDKEHRILVNKLDLRDKEQIDRKEEEGLARATLNLLHQKRDPPEELTPADFTKAHGLVFGELYEWAGRLRTVNIAKEHMKWPPPKFLGQAMDDFAETCLKGFVPTPEMTDEEFIKGVAKLQGEFLAVHPFREGNARTVKLCSNILARQSDRPILAYDKSERGRDEYITAAKFALMCDYKPMEGVIRDALQRAREKESSINRQPEASKTEQRSVRIPPERDRDIESER